MTKSPLHSVRKLLFWPLLLAALAAAVFLVLGGDLRPQVESDFFFASEDPALASSLQIAQRFPAGEQLLISAAGEDLLAPEYLDSLGRLGEELLQLSGVSGVQSLVRGPISARKALEGPFWKRLLTGQSPTESLIVVSLASPAAAAAARPNETDTGAESEASATQLVATDTGQLVRQIELIVERYDRPTFALEMSGVPFVVEQIRRSLERDLKVFSLAALILFGLLIALLYRSWRPVVGILGSGMAAALLTLALLELLGSPIGPLTANIVTIVFVLTLSHTVFLTAAHRRHGETNAAVAETLTPSFWSMATTFLGFASLLLASAKPLRELGFAGALGTLVALLVAYALYPRLLEGWHARASLGQASSPAELDRPARWPLALTALACLVAAAGLPLLNTDPSLLGYFAKGSEIRQGLERIDRNGGSSPLLVTLVDQGGEDLSQEPVLRRMQTLQTALEQRPEVGSALSLPVLLAEARDFPLAGLLSTDQLLNILDSPRLAQVGRSFVTADRQEGMVLLRLREAERQHSRREVVAGVLDQVRANGFEPRLIGGLYHLQGELGQLVGRSLVQGLGGLMLLFALIALAVARQWPLSLAMVLCLLPVPIMLLGGLGLARQPLDLIASPGINVAIALGIDAMIHLVMAVRRAGLQGLPPQQAWSLARAQLTPAVLRAAVILAAGFGIFALSSFPPTQRFGMVVALGTLAAAAMALLVLPSLVPISKSKR